MLKIIFINFILLLFGSFYFFPSLLERSESDEKIFAEKMGISQEYLYTFYNIARKADVLPLDVRIFIERVNVVRTAITWLKNHKSLYSDEIKEEFKKIGDTRNNYQLDNLETLKKIQDIGIKVGDSELEAISKVIKFFSQFKNDKEELLYLIRMYETDSYGLFFYFSAEDSWLKFFCLPEEDLNKLLKDK